MWVWAEHRTQAESDFLFSVGQADLSSGIFRFPGWLLQRWSPCSSRNTRTWILTLSWIPHSVQLQPLLSEFQFLQLRNLGLCSGLSYISSVLSKEQWWFPVSLTLDLALGLFLCPFLWKVKTSRSELQSLTNNIWAELSCATSEMWWFTISLLFLSLEAAVSQTRPHNQDHFARTYGVSQKSVLVWKVTRIWKWFVTIA